MIIYVGDEIMAEIARYNAVVLLKPLAIYR